MLSIALPHVDAWNSWYRDIGNRPAGVPALRQRVDAACRAVGRDPAEIERTVAVLVQLSGGTGREHGEKGVEPVPVRGSSEEIAEVLRGFAGEGIGEVQLVVDPITARSIEALAPVLEILAKK